MVRRCVRRQLYAANYQARQMSDTASDGVFYVRRQLYAANYQAR